jgi:hypothetical protein
LDIHLLGGAIMKFRTALLFSLTSIWLVISANAARCGDEGFDVAKNDWAGLKAGEKPDADLEDGLPGVTASDFYKLVDNSIGTNFGGLILVFGGCFTDDFSNDVPPKLAKKPVAILASTNKDKKYQACPSLDGKNPFLDTLQESWIHADELGDGTLKDMTTEEAFNLAKEGERGKIAKYNKDTAEPHLNETVNGKRVELIKQGEPSFTAFPRDQKDPAGAKLTLGKAAGKKYAILFMGKPETYYDWNFFVQQYKGLKDAGYEVDAMFGTGMRQDDGTPFLTNKDSGNPGLTVNKEAEQHGNVHDIQDVNGADVRYRAATFRKLKVAFTKWKLAAEEDKAGTNQYVFIVGTHSTLGARDRNPDTIKIELPPDNKGGKSAEGGDRNKRPRMAEKKKSAAGKQSAKSNEVGMTPSQADLLNTGIGIGLSFGGGGGGGRSHRDDYERRDRR